MWLRTLIPRLGILQPFPVCQIDGPEEGVCRADPHDGVAQGCAVDGADGLRTLGSCGLMGSPLGVAGQGPADGILQVDEVGVVEEAGVALPLLDQLGS